VVSAKPGTTVGSGKAAPRIAWYANDALVAFTTEVVTSGMPPYALTFFSLTHCPPTPTPT